MRERVDFESACLLHHRVVGEQDAVLTVLTRRYGRLSLWVRGKLSEPGVIPLFKPVLISWQNVNGSHRLLSLEVDSGYPLLLKAQLTSDYLFSGFYVNELMIRFLPEFADVSSLYEDYLWFLESMSQKVFIEPVLRIFERQLLLGVGRLNDLSLDLISGQDVSYEHYYQAIHHNQYGVGITRTLVPQTLATQTVIEDPRFVTLSSKAISGKTLINFNENRLSELDSLREVKLLMRWFIHCLLDGKPLKTRLLFKSFKREPMSSVARSNLNETNTKQD